MKKTLKRRHRVDTNNFNWCIISCIFSNVFLFNVRCRGKSMMPTLQDGNMLVVNKVSYQVGDLNRFDVVVFHANKRGLRKTNYRFTWGSY